MAISNFLTTVWSTRINQTLRLNHILAQPNVVNRHYQPDVEDARVFHAHTLEDLPQVDYDSTETDPGANKIAYKALNDRRVTGTMDEEHIVAWYVEDINRLQANANYVSQMTMNAGYRLSEGIETWLAEELADGIPATDTAHIFKPTRETGISSIDTGYAIKDGGTASTSGGKLFLNLLADIKVQQTKDGVPATGRVLIVPPEFTHTIWDSPKLEKDTDRSEMRIANGWIGRLQGYDVYESTYLHDDGTTGGSDVGKKTWAIATHPELYTFALQQPITFEAMRSENRLGWAVRACAVYGGTYLNKVKPGVTGTAVTGACKILVDTVSATQPTS